MQRRKRDDQWGLDWKHGLRDIFDHVTFGHSLPDLSQLTASPADFLHPADSDASVIALPYAPAHDGQHKIGAGVPPRDRHRILEWIGNTLTNFVRPAAACPKVRIQIPSPTVQRATSKRERIATTLRDRHLVIEIHHDSAENPELRQALRSAVTTDLGLDAEPKVVGAESIWNTAELTVTITEEAIGERAGALEPGSGAFAQRAYQLRQAVESRQKLIRTQLSPITGKRLAFIELGGRDTFAKANTDPKGAIRIGYMDAGRLTQFIRPDQPGNGNLDHRAAKAWKDLRRQLVGCMEPPRVILRGKDAKALPMPELVDTVGIYMLRRNATERNWTGREQTPLAVWISSDSADAYALIPGLDTWVPYGDLHGLLADGIAFKETSTDKQAAANFIGTVINTTRNDARPVLLQTWTQNLRGEWPDLNANRLSIDSPRLRDRPLGRAFDNFRLVTIRTKDSGEIPETYGAIDADVLEDTGGKQFGMPKGLWRVPVTARTFISTAGRPDSAKTHASPMSSRIGPRFKEVTDEETNETSIAEIWELTKPAYNAHGLHLTAAWLQPNDNPLTWAALTHAHRDLGDAYDATLKLPLALHLAKKATEYAFPETGQTEEEEASE